MPTFSYRAKKEGGEITEGRVEARDKFDAVKSLREKGLDTVFMKEISETAWNMERINMFFSRVTLREKIIFTRNLSSMLDAGIPISRALEILQKQTKNLKFKHILISLKEEIEKGNTFSAAIRKFPEVFSSLFAAMVHSGEETGNLVDTLQTVGKQLEQSYNLRKKIRSAMMYPSVVLAAMVIIAILMFIYVVPSLTATFKEFNMDLPLSTKIIMAISDFLVSNTLAFFVILAAVVVGFVFGLKTSRGQRISDFTVLHFPIISGIVKEYNAAQTTRTLSSLFSSGVNIVEALEITEEVLQNSYYKNVLVKAKEVIQRGIPLSSIFLENQNIYPIMVGEMMQVGEETGKLPDMLEKIATFYEDEVDTVTKDLSTIIEPILMLVIASAVGFFAISMISPMYKLTASI